MRCLLQIAGVPAELHVVVQARVLHASHASVSTKHLHTADVAILSQVAQPGLASQPKLPKCGPSCTNPAQAVRTWRGLH